MKKQVHFAVVQFFGDKYGYAVIKGGDLDGQTVLLNSSGCRETVPGWINRGKPLAEMPTEGKEVVLVLNNRKENHEAFVWGPAKTYIKPDKQVKPQQRIGLLQEIKTLEQPAMERRAFATNGETPRKNHNRLLRAVKDREEDVMDFTPNGTVRRMATPMDYRRLAMGHFNGPRRNPNQRCRRVRTQGIAS